MCVMCLCVYMQYICTHHTCAHMDIYIYISFFPAPVEEKRKALGCRVRMGSALIEWTGKAPCEGGIWADPRE